MLAGHPSASSSTFSGWDRGDPSTHPCTQHLEVTRQSPTLLGLCLPPASQGQADSARAPSTLQLHCRAGGGRQRVKALRGGLCVCVCLRFSTHLSHFASCFGAVPARGPGQQHTLPSDTHTQGAVIPHHPGTPPNLAPLPAARGKHSPAPLGDPALPGSCGQPPPSSAGRKGERKKKVICAIAYKSQLPAPALPSAKTTSPTSTEPSQIPSLPESGWKGSAQPLDPQEKAVGEELRRSGYHDFKAAEPCPGGDPEP